MSGLGYIVLRQRGQSYELLDPEGKLIGLARSLTQALRFAAEVDAPLVREDGVEMKTAR